MKLKRVQWILLIFIYNLAIYFDPNTNLSNLKIRTSQLYILTSEMLKSTTILSLTNWSSFDQQLAKWLCKCWCCLKLYLTHSIIYYIQLYFWILRPFKTNKWNFVPAMVDRRNQERTLKKDYYNRIYSKYLGNVYYWNV